MDRYTHSVCPPNPNSPPSSPIVSANANPLPRKPMKFKITSESINWNEYTPPCKNAFCERTPFGTRSVDDEKRKDNPWWFNSLLNHPGLINYRIEAGEHGETLHVWDQELWTWYVEITTIDDILAIIEEVGYPVEVTTDTLWISDLR